MELQVDKLTALGTQAVQSAIASYTNWFIASAICWLAFGLICVCIARKLWLNREKLNGDFPWAEPVAISLVAIALFTIPCNVPTLLVPRAYAIHQLITDAR